MHKNDEAVPCGQEAIAAKAIRTGTAVLETAVTDDVAAQHAGLTADPASRLVTSLHSDDATSDNVVRVALEGRHATIEPLGRVRADSSGQVSATDEGAKVADSQDALEQGVRGSALLEHSILRHKHSHFDAEPIPEQMRLHAMGHL